MLNTENKLAINCNKKMFIKYLGKLFLSFLFLICIIPLSIADEKSIIRSIEDYLNNFQTITAKFKQITIEDNKVKTGMLYVSKPGKLRFEYLTPQKITIVLNNNQIMYHEHELDETSYTKENNYFFKLLANKKINLQNDISRVISDKNNISLHITKRVDNVNAIIIFATNPITLREVIFENEGQETYHLSFYDIQYNKNLNSRLFSVQNPKFYSAPY